MLELDFVPEKEDVKPTSKKEEVIAEPKYVPHNDSYFDEDEPEISRKDLLAEVLKARFDIRKPLPDKPDYKFFVKNIKSGKLSGVALEGSIVMVSGQSKTRKSSVMASFAAALLNKDGIYQNIETTLRKGTVLWFDTEQNEIEFNYFQRMIYMMAGVDSINPNIRYLAFNIRKYTEEQRAIIVEEFVKAFGDVVFVVVDGIADLISSVNDMEGTKRLTTKLCKWADVYKTPIMITIHTNKDGKDATGSLGGFLDKKSSYHIRTSKEEFNGPTKVEVKHARGGEGFVPYEFEHTQNGIPTVVYDMPFIGLSDDSAIEGTPSNNNLEETPF